MNGCTYSERIIMSVKINDMPMRVANTNTSKEFSRLLTGSWRLCLAIALLAAAVPLAAQVPVAPKASPPVISPYATVETHRIRVANVEGGAIELSDDHGQSWQLAGRVMIPATDSLMGYLASGYSQPGTVCATAVHGIRIRIEGAGSAYPKLINIVPVEFVQTPDLFGGQVSGISGIYTNIPSGTGIFRNLAPHAGDPVFLQGDNGVDLPVPADYRPKVGDILTIIVSRPLNGLREVDIENRTGGSVKGTYEDGSSQNLCQVIQPVQGVGRFDGTSYTGVGAINTNHSGVITVSTAPVTTSTLTEGDGPERRGGFQIEPAYHNSQSDEAGAPMILVLGHPKKTRVPDLEGTTPLFHGYFDLSWNPRDPDHSWIAQMQTAKSGERWLPMRQVIGYHPAALRDFTAIRLVHHSVEDAAWIHREIANDVQAYANSRLLEARSGRIGVRRGSLTLRAIPNTAAIFAALYVDGQLKTLSNSPPFDLSWDTSDSPDGEYLVEIRTVDTNGKTLTSLHKVVWVDNRRQVAER